MIRCPHCDSPESTVLETRHHPHGLYRRRVCGYCRERYSTVEAVVDLPRGRPTGPTPKRHTGPHKRK